MNKNVGFIAPYHLMPVMEGSSLPAQSLPTIGSCGAEFFVLKHIYPCLPVWSETKIKGSKILFIDKTYALMSAMNSFATLYAKHSLPNLSVFSPPLGRRIFADLRPPSKMAAIFYEQT